MITQIMKKDYTDYLKKANGQASLELATAIICIFLILIASAKLCTWAIGRMVVRQEDFENTRIIAANTNIGVEVDESSPTRYQDLHFFE